MSWREFRFNLRPIALLAFGCVVFTTCAVAAAMHYLLGWQWGVAFLLGAIVAPPDVVAPLAIARRLGLPRRLVVVLEGEGLANDATALILYRFAVAAVATGAFSLGKAAGTFALIVVGEIVWGIAVGWLALRLRHWARNPRVEITLSLMTPVPRLLGARAPRRLGRAGDRRRRALRELERAAADLGLDPAAGHLLLGPDHLPDRKPGVPGHRPAGAHAAREGAVVLDPRSPDRDRDHHGDRHRGALRLDVSGDLPAALAQPVAAPARSVAALADGRSSWRSPACAAWSRSRPRSRFRSPRSQRRAVPAARPDPVRHLRRHHRHAGRARTDAAERGALARPASATPAPSRQREREAELAARAQALDAALAAARSDRGGAAIVRRSAGAAARPPRPAHAAAAAKHAKTGSNSRT